MVEKCVYTREQGEKYMFDKTCNDSLSVYLCIMEHVFIVVWVDLPQIDADMQKSL